MKALVFTTGGTHLTTMLGMLEELSDRGRLCEIDSYAGISAGAILAAFCATRPVKTAVKELQDILIHHCKDAIKPHYKFLNMPLSALFKKSLLDDSGLANLLKERLENAPLCATLYVGLTNETDMRYELHRFAPNEKRGSLSLSQAVHASASIRLSCRAKTRHTSTTATGSLSPNACHRDRTHAAASGRRGAEAFGPDDYCKQHVAVPPQSRERATFLSWQKNTAVSGLYQLQQPLERSGDS